MKNLNSKLSEYSKMRPKSKSGKIKGTGGKACWKGYKRVGANGCTKTGK